MPDEQKETFPVIPVKHWWTLRARFQQSMPGAVTPGFVATTLGMQERSAKSNIIPSLVMMGIIDQDGKPTDRAIRWRDDVEYAEVCREIREEIYPQELLDAAPGPSINRPSVERWFATKTGTGQVATRRFAVVYELLATATLPEKETKSTSPTRPKPTTKRRPKAAAVEKPPIQKAEKPVTFSDLEPSIHINIQIHISPDAKPSQIDEIFASMAKHLRNLRVGND